MYLSEAEIKTFDMSLPSYDAINTLKVDDKALGVENAPEPAAMKTKQPKPKKESGSSGSSGMSSVLPSMNKSGPSKKKPKPPKKVVEKVEKVAPASKEEYETMDFSLPSYSGTESKGKDFFAL